MFDIAIIGSGPAGLSAAVNAKIRNKSFIIFGNSDYSSKLLKAPKINNYLGFFDISGIELKEKFKSHIENMGIEINNEKVNSVYDMGDYFAIMCNDDISYKSKTIIIATGMEFGKPLKGEADLLGKGVGYCATCDAPLYKNKDVAIIGYNKEAEIEANFVSELCKRTYYIPMYSGELTLNNNIKVIKSSPLEIVGEEKVEKIICKDLELKVDGVFVLKDSIPPSELVPGLKMNGEHIDVDRNMATNLSGCFACGDCTGKPYQYMKSVGEGQVAALSAVSFL